MFRRAAAAAVRTPTLGAAESAPGVVVKEPRRTARAIFRGDVVILGSAPFLGVAILARELAERSRQLLEEREIAEI